MYLKKKIKVILKKLLDSFLYFEDFDFLDRVHN